jgi:hypothetical protein
MPRMSGFATNTILSHDPNVRMHELICSTVMLLTVFSTKWLYLNKKIMDYGKD